MEWNSGVVCRFQEAYRLLSEALSAFRHKLTIYKTSKGAIQFPIEEPIPEELVKEMVRFRVRENEKAK